MTADSLSLLRHASALKTPSATWSVYVMHILRRYLWCKHNDNHTHQRTHHTHQCWSGLKEITDYFYLSSTAHRYTTISLISATTLCVSRNTQNTSLFCRTSDGGHGHHQKAHTYKLLFKVIQVKQIAWIYCLQNVVTSYIQTSWKSSSILKNRERKIIITFPRTPYLILIYLLKP